QPDPEYSRTRRRSSLLAPSPTARTPRCLEEHARAAGSATSNRGYNMEKKICRRMRHLSQKRKKDTCPTTPTTHTYLENVTAGKRNDTAETTLGHHTRTHVL
ncbi:unnamed protein product, partial [Ectocarpus sp. 12 AP-2014]